MKKLNKSKILLLVIIAVVAIIATIVIISIVNKGPKEPIDPDIQQIIPLPETTYSNMEVKNIEMEYLKNNNETMVTLEIHNTTSEPIIEKEKFDVIWVGPDGEALGQLPTSISNLNVGEVIEISVIMQGDLTATQQIKLVEKK